MSLETYGWLVLAFPLGGAALIALTFRALPDRAHGVIGTLAILLCIELMLNAANLALVGFSRVHGNMDGQIFALIVMVIAACEVAIGLGLIVALFRRRLPIDVDELRELQG